MRWQNPLLCWQFGWQVRGLIILCARESCCILRSSFLALFLAVLCRLHLVVFHVPPTVALLLPMRRREFTIGDAGAYFPRFPRSSKVTLKQQQSRALDGQTLVLLCKIPHETGGTNERRSESRNPTHEHPTAWASYLPLHWKLHDTRIASTQQRAARTVAAVDDHNPPLIHAIIPRHMTTKMQSMYATRRENTPKSLAPSDKRNYSRTHFPSSAIAGAQLSWLPSV
jgi:hypothetical protein